MQLKTAVEQSAPVYSSAAQIDNAATSVVSLFDQSFAIISANTIALKQEAYAIRYQVYCQDLQYEQGVSSKEKAEVDAYDSCSEHFLLLHKPSNKYIGCVRLIHKQSQRPLPFEKVSGVKTGQVVKHLMGNAEQYCELSRLVVLPEYRQKIALMPRESETVPYVSISLILAGIMHFIQSGHRYCFAMMEPKLVRLLNTYGLHVQQASTLVNYKGKRAVFVLSAETSLNNMPTSLQDLSSFVQSKL
jgi:N-acyl amino acid synthase of PEP-CTERM/exosortase system